MTVTEIELWRLSKNKGLFDSSRSGRQEMDWDVVLIRLGTDVGIDGYATAMAARSGVVTLETLKEVVAPVVVGRDVTDRELIWHEFWTIDRHLTFFPVFLPGPIDVALYDIAAKHAGLPLFRFLGAYRTSLPVYASSLFMDKPSDYADQAKEYAAKGFTAYKAHPPGNSKRDMEVHHALREEMGPEFTLMTDPVGEYALEEAVRVGRDLEQLDYYWFEEPFRDFELEKYARLTRTLDIPVAGTETTRGAHWGVAQAIARGAVDIVRADVSWKAGVTGTLKIAHMAEAFGMQCEIHTAMGPMDVANLHVSCAIRNCEYHEVLVPEAPFRFPLKQGVYIDNEGFASVSEKPGLGIDDDIDWDVVEASCTGRYRIGN